MTTLLVAALLLSGLAALTTSAAHRLSIVVMARSGQTTAAEQAVKGAGGTLQTTLPGLDAFTATVDQSAVPAIVASPAVASATPDGNLQLLSDSTSPYDPSQDPYSLYNTESETGVRSMWSQDTGSGIGVALVDSGVTPVPGLQNVVQGPDFTNQRFGPDAHLDTFGHGTFMAGIIAGDQDGVDPAANANDPSPFLGVAPEASLVSVKVANADGSTSLNQILEGISWVIQNDARYNIRVMNLSFGVTPQDSYMNDPLAFAVERAWADGIVVVVSAGNNGPTSDGLNDPAYDPFVIAVGAEDPGTTPGATPTVAPFSSWGDGTRNPDFLAPGMHVQSLADPGSIIDNQFALTGAISSSFFRGSGTSEAAAYTSGLVALLIQEYPSYSPDQLKALLTSTADPIPGVGAEAQGNGVVDLTAAAGPQSSATASAVSTPQSFTPAGPPATTTASSASSNCPASTPAPTGSGQDLSGQNLSNQNFTGQSLAGDDLQGAQLQGADLAGVDLHGADLQGAQLQGADLAGANLTGANLQSADAAGANFQAATLIQTSVTGLVLRGASLQGISDWRGLLKDAAGYGDIMFMAQACAPAPTGSSWSGSSWSGSSWSGSSWSGSSWSGSSWSGSSWSGSSWSGSSWSGSSWSGSSWSGSSWSTATWT